MLNEMQTLGSHAAAEVDVIDEPGLDWLLKVEKGKEVVICALAEGVFVQTLIGYKKGKDWNTEKLLNWNFGACDEWRIRDGSEQGWRHPMEGCSTEELDDADKLVYMRNIEGMLDIEVYFEIDQRMSQALGLHWRKEMHGWGRLNGQGDWETIVTWCMDKKPNDGRDCHLVTMKRTAVDAVAKSLGGQVITVFDVKGGGFGPITENTERAAFWAEWNLDMAPLDELMAVIKTLNGKWWWRAPDDTQLARARTAWTESTREWGEEIKYLHQIVVESLNEGGLRKCAVSGGILQEDANCLRGIQLVATVLMQKGKTEEEAAVRTRPLADLARMRNVADAHRSTKKRAELIKDMRSQHGSLHSAYTATVDRCTRELEQIARIL